MQTDQITGSTAKKGAPKARVKATAKTKTKSAPEASYSSPPSDLASMIAMAAYFHAERRGFEPGHELEDWLAAEQQVKTSYDS